MKRFFIIPGILSFLLFSCNKEETYQRTGKIIIGDETDMIITTYDTIFAGHYNQGTGINLDVDTDGTNDFQLSSVIWGSPGMGQHPRSDATCLHNNAQFYGLVENDTTFLHTTITIYPDETNNTIIVYKSSLYSCRRVSSDDTALFITENQFNLQPLEKEDYISREDYFQADTCVLSNNGTNIPTLPVYGQDTVFYYANYYDNSCHYFPNDNLCYIGFRIGTGEKEKLGWIKIIINDSFRITLLETAIQK